MKNELAGRGVLRKDAKVTRALYKKYKLSKILPSYLLQPVLPENALLPVPI